MTIVMTPLNQYDPAVPAVTDFSQTTYQIIEAAHRYIGEAAVYDDWSKNLLQMVVLNLQSKGHFFWNTEEVIQAFIVPSRVNGDGDSKIYTAYHGHSSVASNRPPTGANWARYWYEDTEAASADDWVIDTAYTATGDFFPSVDTLDIENAYIRFEDKDYPVDIVSQYKFNEFCKKQEVGRPRILYFDWKTTPRILLYPQVAYDDVDDYLLIYTRKVKLSNQTGTSEMDADFKSIWLLPLALSLAKELAAQRYNLPMERVLYLENKAEVAVNNARKYKGSNTIQRKG